MAQTGDPTGTGSGGSDLPNLPAEFPQTSPGVQSWETLPMSASFGFSGYIGHYHLTNQKWDPGPFDFKDFCRKLRGSLCFPVFPKDDSKQLANAQPTIPQQPDDLKDAVNELYKANEARADGGFFPIGPWGALLGPAKLPPEIVARLNRETVAILAKPEIREQMQKVGFAAKSSTPDQLAAYLRDQLAIWKKALADAGIEPQ